MARRRPGRSQALHSGFTASTPPDAAGWRTLTVVAGTRDEEVIHVGGLEVRPSEGLALADGRALALSAREVAVLVALARRANRVIGRAELYELAWGGELRDGDRTVDVYVHRLRAKLEAAVPARRFIHTHVGFGYRFSPEPFTRLSQPGHSAVTS
jgi:DNA-binding response OmpR family regulator